jgi:predicted dehydrogenase
MSQQLKVPRTGAEPVRAALLGLGRMGRVHARAIAGHVPELDVVAVAEPAEELRRRAGDFFGAGVRAYASSDEALEHPGLEACVIVTPTHSHPEVCRRAIERGLHVMCEKPLALDVGETDAIGRLAQDAERILQVGFWRRFAPTWVEAKRLIDAGAIGRPVWARSSQWDAGIGSLYLCDPAVTGGLMIDLGVHDFDLVEWLTGERITSVETRVLRMVEPALTEIGDMDNAHMLLELSGDVSGLVDLSRNAAYGDDVRTEVLGEHGAVFVDTLPHGMTVVGTAAGLRDALPTPVEDAFLIGVAAELRAFAQAIRGELDPASLPGAEASARSLAVALAAQASARQGAPVALDEREPLRGAAGWAGP